MLKPTFFLNGGLDIYVYSQKDEYKECSMHGDGNEYSF